MTPTGIPELVLRLVALGGITAAATWAVIELKSREHECGTSAVFKKQILKRGQKESDWSCAGLDEIARICVAEGSYRTLHARWWGRWPVQIEVRLRAASRGALMRGLERR